MNLSILILSVAAQAADPVIVVTAAREPVARAEAPASVTLFEGEQLYDLGLPNAADLLRLSPGLAVATAGPRGSQTQVRIRGAEANHTLLFVDGIRFNDPAAGNEARFELLTSDALSRLEVVRGPQSALWGSEALGGVIAAGTADPFRGTGFEGLGEYGSLDSSRLTGRFATRTGDFGIAATAGWQRSDGIDSFGAGAERDGFTHLAGSLKTVYRAGPIEIGAVGHWVEGRSEFDGFDPLTFLRADTLDETESRIGAVRGWGSGEWDDWTVRAEASYLDSANRNSLDGAPVNSTYGDRLTLGGQLSRRIGGHSLIAAVDHQNEDFRARDAALFGGTDQDRSRHLIAIVGEWRARWSEEIESDVALRHDSFSAFADATTLRAALLAHPVRHLTLHAAYGEGIAQPTFYDLYGFFPGSFVGNPDLKAERSRAWEAGISWDDGRFSASATFFRARLRDEIIDSFDPASFLSSTENAEGESRRTGIELSAGYRHAAWLNLTANYTFLDADEQRAAGAKLVREVRRPRTSFNLAAWGSEGRFRWGASLAYVGDRRDTDFDQFPAATVTLDEYVLASVNAAYRLAPALEAFVRVENAFDADYRDVVGYNMPGRTVYAGLRVTLGD